MLLYRLGDPDFVKGDVLSAFNAVNDPAKCTVLLAPSGAGKTRKLFELLFSKFGYFIPFKMPNDKNDGSLALSSVIGLLKCDTTVDWQETKPSPELYNHRRSRAEFAISCVLVAFASVFLRWRRSKCFRRSQTPQAFRWLLVQLFPSTFLKSDVFEIVAKRLYKECAPDEILKFSGFPKDFLCVLDEAQLLGVELPKAFMTSTPGQRDSDGTRPLLSPFLHGIREALGRFPIISGTGMTLLTEWSSIVSATLTSEDFIFSKFPLLSADEVKDMLERFLIVNDQNIHWASHWLKGRPRITTEFITISIAKNLPIEACLKDYLKWATTTHSFGSRTFFDGFKRLEREKQRMTLGGEAVVNPYETALTDAFLLSVGWDIKPRISPALLELGLGYPETGHLGRTRMMHEPFVLETARLLISKDFPAFESEFLRSVSDNDGHLGKRFEIVAALKLLKYLSSGPLENTSVCAGIPLPTDFHGHWQPQSEPRYGEVATRHTRSEEFYGWFDMNESILFPDQSAGPDIVLRLKQGSKTLQVYIQDKVKEKLSDLEGALLTVDPRKFHHQKRGKEDEHVLVGVKDAHAKFVAGLKQPVVRILVAPLQRLPQKSGLVQNSRGGQDLVLILDSENTASVLGEEFMMRLKEIKS